MGVKQVFDHSLRACGKRFLSSLKASNRYSEGYLASLETTIDMAAQYAEEQGWPDMQAITTEVHRGLLAYLCGRDYCFPIALKMGKHSLTLRVRADTFILPFKQDTYTMLADTKEQESMPRI